MMGDNTDPHRRASMTTPMSHYTLGELVKSYRTLASELRGHERRRPGVTTYSVNRVVRMNRITDELGLRGQEKLRDLLGQEHAAYDFNDSGETLRARRRAVKETLGSAEHAEAYRKQLLERYEALHEVFSDSRSRKEQSVAEINAWWRTVKHMPAMEQSGVVPGSNKWYSTFLEIFDRVTKGERETFSKQLDDLVHEYRLHRAGVMGFAPGVKVRQKITKGLVRFGTVVSLRTSGVAMADVDWHAGDPVRGYPLDELDVVFPPGHGIEARISYMREGRVWNEYQVTFDEFEDIVGTVRTLLEEGATEIHIDDIAPDR